MLIIKKLLTVLLGVFLLGLVVQISARTPPHALVMIDRPTKLFMPAHERCAQSGKYSERDRDEDWDLVTIVEAENSGFRADDMCKDLLHQSQSVWAYILLKRPFLEEKRWNEDGSWNVDQ